MDNASHFGRSSGIARLEPALALQRFATSVRPERVALTLAIIVTALLVLGFFANVVIYNLAPSTEHAVSKLMKRFDLGHEPSLPNWYSSLALLGSAILLATISAVLKDSTRLTRLGWNALAALFLLLAADEAILIHEMADAPMHNWLDTDGFLYFAWVIPYTVFAAAVGIVFIPFLRQLDSDIRNLFLVSGILFVGGAIGIELIEGSIVANLGVERGFQTLQLTIAQTAAEALEMYAIVLFLYTLLRQLDRSTS